MEVVPATKRDTFEFCLIVRSRSFWVSRPDVEVKWWPWSLFLDSAGSSGQWVLQRSAFAFWSSWQTRVQTSLQETLGLTPCSLCWSWQQAGWEDGLERRGWCCQTLHFPKWRRDLLAQNGCLPTNPQEGSSWEACLPWSAWVLLGANLPLTAISNFFEGNWVLGL